jgi:transcriptional regulator with XRE-family HTH domain
MDRKCEKYPSGRCLRALRKEKGYKAEYVAQRCNCSPQAIFAYENGTRNPRDPTKVKLADLYGKTVQELFFGGKKQ